MVPAMAQLMDIPQWTIERLDTLWQAMERLH